MDTPDILENENSDVEVDDGNQRDEDVGNRSFLEEEKEGESRDVFEDDEDMPTTLETSDQPHLVIKICLKKIGNQLFNFPD